MILSANLVVIANIISSIGLLFFLVSSFVKNRKNVALTQSGNHILNFVAWILLGTYSGAVQEMTSLIRNIFVVIKKQNKILDIVFIVLGLTLGIVFNVDSWLGILPIIANCQYSIVILKSNNIVLIKLSMIFSCICWSIYSFVTLNYASAIFNIVTAIATMVFIIIHTTRKKNAEANTGEAEEIAE